MTRDQPKQVRDALIQANEKLGLVAANAIKDMGLAHAERDALKADAMRYRWLREHHQRSVASHRLTWYLPVTYPLNEQGLDASIDAAMQGEKE